MQCEYDTLYTATTSQNDVNHIIASRTYIMCKVKERIFVVCVG